MRLFSDKIIVVAVFQILIFVSSASAQSSTKLFKDDKAVYEVTIPADWKELRSKGIAEFIIQSPDLNETQLRLETNKYPKRIENMSLAEMSAIQLEQLKQDESTGANKLINSKTILINGKSWWLMDYVSSKNTRYQCYQTIHNKVRYAFYYISNNTEFDRYAKTAEDAVRTFVFLNKDLTVYENNASGLNNTSAADPSQNATSIDYAAINDFHEGYAIVRKGERYAMIDAAGKEFIPLGKYNFSMDKESYGSKKDACGFYNGMSVVKDVETEKYGYIDSTGKLAVPCTLSQAENFLPDGYAHGGFTDREKNLYLDYFFDKKGKRYAAKKLTGDSYSSPFVITQSPDGKTTIFTRKNGTKAFETKYRVENYSEGMYRVIQFFDNNISKCGFMDTTGKLVIPFRLTNTAYMDGFKEGLALYQPKFTDEYLYTYLNTKGDEVLYLKKQDGVDRAFNFENGYADVNLTSNKKALIDKAGKLIIAEELFKQANPQIMKDLSTIWTSNFRFQYIKRNLYGIIFEVELALKLNSPSAKVLSNGNERSTGGVGASQKDYTIRGTGMMDYNGHLLVLPQFSDIGNFDPISGLAKAICYDVKSKQTKQGFINKQGQFVLVMKDNNNTFIKY